MLVTWLERMMPLCTALLACPSSEAPPHASVRVPTNRDPWKTAGRKLGHQSHGQGSVGLHPVVCLHVRSEHVRVPLVLFGNDLLELQNLVSLYISALTFAVF